MSPLDFNQIPGYAAAVNSEQVNRDLAFLPECLPICGVPICHITARHFLLLAGCRNRFIAGGQLRAEDVAMFLWFMSPRYSTTPGEREAFVAEYVRPLDFVAACREIVAYLGRAFQDSNPADGGGKEFTSPVAGIIDLLAAEYGWDDDAILDKPLARIFQYFRRIQMRKNPEAPMINRSEKYIGEWLAKQQTERTNP